MLVTPRLITRKCIDLLRIVLRIPQCNITWEKAVDIATNHFTQNGLKSKPYAIIVRHKGLKKYAISLARGKGSITRYVIDAYTGEILSTFILHYPR